MGYIAVKPALAVSACRIINSMSGEGARVHYGYWATVFAAAVACGASLVGLLALRRTQEAVMFFIGLLGIATSTWAITRLVLAYGQLQVALVGALIALAAAAGGYGLASALLPRFAPKLRTHELPDPLPADDDRITVLVLACIEPEQYEPSAVAADLGDLADAGLVEPTIGITPFLFAAQKARYRAAGGRSPSALAALHLVERLESMLDDRRLDPVELVACSLRDTLDEAIVRAARRGCRRVVVANLSVGESYVTDRAKTRADLLRPEQAGVRVVYTPPLWGSEPLAEDLARRIWGGRDDPESTGVALIMHGQPEARERTHGAFDVQENAFCNRIRLLLAERGIPESNVRLGYLDWRSPDVTETVRHLAALGCRRVLVVPACFPFESVNTVLDLQVAVRQARVDAHVSTVVFSAWGEDDVVARILKDAVEDALADL